LREQQPGGPTAHNRDLRSHPLLSTLRTHKPGPGTCVLLHTGLANVRGVWGLRTTPDAGT
jgi:hypothetical protein